MSYKPLTLGQIIEERSKEYQNKTYLLFDDAEISYKNFNRNINQVANGLLGLEVKKGTHVGIHLFNCPQFLYAVFALAKIGAPVVPTNLALTVGELSYILDHADVEIVITSSVFLELVKSIKPNCRNLKKIIVIDAVQSDLEVISWPELLQDTSHTLNMADPPAPDDVIALMYTSGTTSLPKGVMLAHQHFIEGARYWMWAAGFTAKDRTITPLPLCHVNALIYSVIGSMIFGGSVVLLERFSATQYFQQIKLYNVTHINFGGPLMSVLMSFPENPGDPLNPVRVASSAMGSPEINAAFEKRYQIKVLMNYSLTESTVGLSTPISGPKILKLGCLGYPMPSPPFHCEARVVDNNGNDVPPGVTGEIILRTPAVMLGYYKQPDKTAEVLKDGWLYTGDLAYIDKDGFFWFVDRKKDVIKRKGENVSSQEVEFIIGNHPKVLAVAVIGVLDAMVGEEIKACIILKQGETAETVTPQEIIQWCKQRMALFKMPRYLEYRDRDFPRTLGGAKILKRDLKIEKEDLTQGCYDHKKGQWLK